ncbi:MAG: hypothetical protein R3B93_22570 [Bacteroidia bacterium]
MERLILSEPGGFTEAATIEYVQKPNPLPFSPNGPMTWSDGAIHVSF